MVTQAKGTLLQRSRRLLGRGYALFTYHEIKLAQKLQQKIPFGYLLVRAIGLITKLALAVILLFVLGWLLILVLAVVAFFASDTKQNSQGMLEETIGSSEHFTKYPWRYDEDGNYR